MGKNKTFNILFLQYTLHGDSEGRNSSLMISGLTSVFRVLKLHITSYDQHRFRHKFQKNLPFWNCSIYVEALKFMSLNQSSEDVRNLKQLLYGSRNPK